VVGINFSLEMLAIARRKLRENNLPQLEFRESVGEKLDFTDQSFDMVLGTLGLIFMPDTLGALREWHRVLKPGEKIGFTSFGEGLYRPFV